MNHPLIRVSYMATATYFGAILGNAVSLNPFITLLGYPSFFSKILWNSFYILTIYYILMIFSLYYSMNTFKKLYYLLFLAIGWHIHNLFAYITYSSLNLLISLPNFLNLIIYLSIGTAIFIQGIYSEQNTTLEYINLICPGLKGTVTFAHLTDIHLGAIYGREFIQKLVNLILTIQVDFVCITGDMIDGNIKMTREMIEPFQQITCPIYFVSGNHEDYTWREEAYQIIDTTNIKRMEDSYINFDNKINIIGIDYLKNTETIVAKLKYLLSDIRENNNGNNYWPNIFLYHVPIFTAKDLEKYDIFLFLCGHYHGGHFFPFTLLKYVFKYCKNIVFEGLYNYNNIHYVYCNSGQGTSGPAVRSCSKSQIGIIKLVGQ